MDTARYLPQIGQENPRVSTSPDQDDELFYSIFDWQGYCNSTKPEIASPLPGRSTPRDLSKLITEIPYLIEDYSLESLGHEFYRMTTNYSPDDEAGTSSSFSGQTPPELVRGGSTSPSDHSGSISLERADEGRQRPDVSLQEVQAQDDKWTYPQTDPSKHAPRDYPPHLHVQDDSSRRPKDQGSNLKRRRSGNNLEKRQRQLSDPAETAGTRKNGACMPCRVTKTRCQENGVCPTCRKGFPNHAHLVCARQPLATSCPVVAQIGDIWLADPTEEQPFVHDSRLFTGNRREIAVYFSKDHNAAKLRARVQAYQSYESYVENPKKASFPREEVPQHAELWAWVGTQIQRESSSDFRSVLQNFLLSYSEEGYGLPMHGLVQNVHRMNCFFRIWKTPSFWCRDPRGQLTDLPFSVQVELRSISKVAFQSLELDVAKQLDDIVAQQSAIKSQDRLAIWASVWQLMLMYRDLFAAYKQHTKRPHGFVREANWMSEHYYRANLERCFPTLAMFYRYQFRTKKSLELSLDWLKSPPYPVRASSSKRIRSFAKGLIDSRKKFYESMQQSKAEIDGLLCVFVINHELKKLSARRRTPKGSSRSKGGDDDCDEVA